MLSCFCCCCCPRVSLALLSACRQQQAGRQLLLGTAVLCLIASSSLLIVRGCRHCQTHFVVILLNVAQNQFIFDVVVVVVVVDAAPKVRAEFRKVLMFMGFEEMPTNRWVESSFWNFDSLFQPQVKKRNATTPNRTLSTPIWKTFPFFFVDFSM